MASKHRTGYEFHVAHAGPDGKDWILTNSGAWMIYPDGSLRENSEYGGYIDSEDIPAVDRANNIMRYWEEKLSLAVEEFTYFKENLERWAERVSKHPDCNAPPNPPTDKEISDLQLLKIKCTETRKHFNKARKDFNRLNAPETQRLKERSERCEANRQQASTVLTQINDINI